MDVNITVTGIDEIIEYINNMPKESIKRAISKGLVAGANPIFDAIQARKPSDAYLGGILKPGELMEGLKTNIEIAQDGSGGHMAIGFSKKTAPVARYLEFGHRELGSGDQITTWVGKKGKSKGKVRRKNKPGSEVEMVPAYPFVRPAIETSQEAALDAFIDAVSESFAEEV